MLWTQKQQQKQQEINRRRGIHGAENLQSTEPNMNTESSIVQSQITYSKNIAMFHFKVFNINLNFKIMF